MLSFLKKRRFLIRKTESYATSCDDYDLDGDEAFILDNERSAKANYSNYGVAAIQKH